MEKVVARWGLVTGCGSALCLFLAPFARAESATDKTTAEVLFKQAREKLAAGDYAAACPAFEASQRLDPAAGTLLNLADCYERVGRIASAWAYFTEVAGMSAATGQVKREAVARQRAEALVPRLANISIRVLGGGAGRTVVRDGTLIDKALFGTPVPVDPGDHLIEVTAPGPLAREFDSDDGWQVRRARDGTQRWRKVARVRLEGATLTVEVPATLAPAPSKSAASVVAPGIDPRAQPVEKRVEPAAPPVADASPPKHVSPGPAPESGVGGSNWNRRKQRILAGVIGGLGVAALAGGAASGAIAQSRWNSAKPHCSAAGACDATGFAGAQSARAAGDASTATFVVGGALVATSVILFVIAQRLPDASAKAAVWIPWSDGRSAGVTLGGTF